MKRLYLVGLGPGDAAMMTAEACAALDDSAAVAGYPLYLDLLGDRIAGKERLTTPMRGELERCRMALAKADEGTTTAMVCSGDAGIYGMAGLVLELASEWPEVQIVSVPGITAAISGAAVLGAPLMNDFAVISLSDLLTPWPMIERRLEGVGLADLVVALYNPSSHKRKDHLSRACDILLKHRGPGCVCGLVRNIGRDGRASEILSLAELRDTEVDMFTTVFIGNSQTVELGGRMVTRRGYAHD